MSYTQRIDVTRYRQTADEIDRFIQSFSPRRLLPRIGKDVVLLFQANYRSLPPNEMGAKTTGFWKRAARSTHYQVGEGGVDVVTSQQGVLQRFMGGVIRAVRAKFLAIPARAEAYGKSPRDFNNLEFVVTSAGPALVESAHSKLKVGRTKKDGTRNITNMGEAGGGVMFWLRRSVRQKSNPDVVPTVAEIDDRVLSAVRDQFELLTGGAQ